MLFGSYGCQALLVYDTTDTESFAKVKNWVKELRKMVGQEIVLCIAGNKIDLDKERQVEKSEAEEYAASVGAYHFQVLGVVGCSSPHRSRSRLPQSSEKASRKHSLRLQRRWSVCQHVAVNKNEWKVFRTKAGERLSAIGSAKWGKCADSCGCRRHLERRKRSSQWEQSLQLLEENDIAPYALSQIVRPDKLDSQSLHVSVRPFKVFIDIHLMIDPNSDMIT